jgi:hypothetical protein
MLTIGMTQLALVIAREAQPRGGVLLHGALAAYPQDPQGLRDPEGLYGVLLAGPGTVGKTTASERLPPPWRSLCDDTTLVVRDAAGQYRAHPWPTWSRFYSTGGVPGPGGSWDVQLAVPLRAIFFLSQSPEDRAEPLHVASATAMLMETVQHVSRPMTHHLSDDETQALYQEQLAAVEALAQAIPAYTLHISLSGKFWKEIERVLVKDEGRRQLKDEGRRMKDETSSFIPHPSSFVVYTGPSMNPTLRQGDLLTVVPYEGRAVQRGDVIYFDPPGRERAVVHRVVRVTSSQGIRTRGDNNSTDDPYLLQASDIIGQVVAAQRGQRRRQIAGGWRGVLVRYGARLWRVAHRGVSPLLHGVYRTLAGTGRFRRLLPAGLRPRVFAFQARQQTFLKLLMGRRVVGQYDTRQEQWRIRRPFCLFVDEATLPCPGIDLDRLTTDR